jgi:endonuclease G, mitochondrial
VIEKKTAKNSSSLLRVMIYAVIALVISYWLTHQLPASVTATTPAVVLSNESTLPFGWPVAISDTKMIDPIQLLKNKCFDVGYSNARANPLWVTYRLTRHKDEGVDKRQSKFITDTRTSAMIVHEHYNRSGYDRGHMAPNHAIGALCDDEAQKETFLMTNISPQSKSLNQRWWERLERVEFNHFTRIFDKVWVIAGPVFADHPINLPNGPVQLPSEFYKVFLAEKAGQWHVLAFLVDQGVEGKEPLSQYRVSMADVTAKTGFDFLPGVPSELKAQLINNMNDATWKLNEVDLIPTRY